MIKDNNDGTYSVITESGDCFNIIASDAHTKPMLDAFLVEGSPELASFESIIAEHGVDKAYNVYNNIPEIPQEPGGQEVTY